MWLERLLDLLGPRECAACGVDLTRGAFCDNCSSQLSRKAESLAGLTVVSLGDYEGPAGAAVRRLKYDRRADLAAPLGRELALALPDRLTSSSVVLVPVPLHRERLRERGFNQAALLANTAARENGNRVRHVLGRDSAGPDQAGASREERRSQVRSRYSVKLDARPGDSALLVDDVVTTGSTLSACRTLLESRGWTVLGGITLARAR